MRIDRLDHQMRVEALAAIRPDRFHDVWTEGDIGHETPVHDVEVDPVCARLIDGKHLPSELGEVSREKGGRNQHLVIHRSVSASVASPLVASPHPQSPRPSRSQARPAGASAYLVQTLRWIKEPHYPLPVQRTRDSHGA